MVRILLESFQLLSQIYVNYIFGSKTSKHAFDFKNKYLNFF